MSDSTGSQRMVLTPGALITFMVFFFLMHELHELAHIITGRIICGCWGHRDFNVWGLCPDCIESHPGAIFATFTGPIFTFLMLWIGRYFIKNKNSKSQKAFGLVLILGNMQFGRILMAALGSGDEVWGLKSIFLDESQSNFWIIRLGTTIVISLICVPPLITAYKAISNKNKIVLFAGLLLIPLILDTVVILIGLNGLLQSGFLSTIWIMNTPALVLIWFVICLLIVGFNFKTLIKFAGG
jgi:hypothetical protein